MALIVLQVKTFLNLFIDSIYFFCLFVSLFVLCNFLVFFWGGDFTLVSKDDLNSVELKCIELKY